MPPILAPIIQLFLTIYYFFYFLAKGKPEWKCPKEKHGGESLKIKNVCCNEEITGPLYTQQSKKGGIYGKITSIPSTIKYYWNKFIEWSKNGYRSMKNNISISSIRNGLKRVGTIMVSLISSAWQIISTFFSTIFSYLLFRHPPSKSMPTSDIIYSSTIRDRSIPSSTIPSTHVPFSSSSIPSPPPPPPPPPPRSNRVSSSHKEEVIIDNDTMNDKVDGSMKGGAFYSTRVYAKNDDNDSSVKSISSMKETVKGGIAVFPPSMMAEIAGSGRSEQMTRSEVNRTPNPTVKERLRDASLTPTHKGTFDYSNGNLPYNSTEIANSKSRVDTPKGWGSYHEDRTMRSKSDGPSRVSRIEDSSSNEAQFIFRAHGSNEDMGYNYRTGRSVYTPMNEIDTVKPRMNRNIDSRASTPSIWSCNNSRVSTPSLYTREEEGGMRQRRRKGRVGDTARTWPPSSNAEGADIGKECFIDGNGIITTSCTRIVQKKNEESWRSYDNNGQIIDEKKEFTLMGDRDEVRRGGPNQANHFSQHYYVDCDGKTRFENTHRQYDKDYVVESVCRNY